MLTFNRLHVELWHYTIYIIIVNILRKSKILTPI